jgi:2-methylcitrate dehydratase PrpD
MGPQHIAQGWHSGATLGVFSAAAGAARALRLDAAATVHALGIAGTQAAGLMAAQYGAMVKRMHAGRSSQSGLYGALLAARGFTGIVNVLESDYGGFCTTFSNSSDRFDLTQLVAGLGERWQTMGVGLKFYACVASNHTTLDALRDMQRERAFGAHEVQGIVVRGSQVTVDHVGWRYVPQGLTSAQLNLPYCVATFLLEGDCFIDQFTEDKVADSERIRLADRVKVIHDAGITARGAEHRHTVQVEVTLTNGKVLHRTVDAPRGSERRFATEAEVVHKFEQLAAKALPRAHMEKLRDAVLDLEHLDDAADIARGLAGP